MASESKKFNNIFYLTNTGKNFIRSMHVENREVVDIKLKRK